MPDKLLESIVDTISEGVYFTDRDRRITFWNKAAERITGFMAGDVTGSRCRDNILRHVDEKGTELCVHGCPLAATMSDGQPRQAQVWLHHRDGHRVPVDVRAAPVTDTSGAIVGAIEIFADRSDRGAVMEELERLKKEALVDQLTRVGNRRFADMTLESRLHELATHKVPFGVVLFDVDHFKKVNDVHGHNTGDRVLAMVSATIAGALRRLDAVARWGGEEFLVIAPSVDLETLEHLAERCRILVQAAWLDLEDGGKLEVTMSGGAALAETGDDGARLVGRADALLYKAKESGRNRVVAR
ncbi:MAG: sensor domain-containing diguanylate cyclase [Spirochaetales bacterium]|nr:sensor domain-containing diguanylate cyclase [Spirochaetales bacterium]